MLSARTLATPLPSGTAAAPQRRLPRPLRSPLRPGRHATRARPPPAAPAAFNGQGYGELKAVEPAHQATETTPAVGPVYQSSIPLPPGTPVRTLHEAWEASVAAHADKPCLGHRTGSTYTYLTYKEAGELAAAVGSAMAHCGLGPHARCSVFGANSPEWMLTMQACNRNSVYCVPLYDVLGDNTVEYIIDHSESSIVFCSADKLPVLARAMHKVQREVGNVVYWRTPSSAGEAALEDLASLGVAVHSFDNFVELGRAHPAPASPPALDDICTIMYTSGTTGTPKGVLLTHRAVSTEVASFCHWISHAFVGINTETTYLSFLPLAHIYGRILEEMCLSLGATIGYWTGEAKGLPADIRALQPMLFSSVPKIFERFESTTLEKLKKASPSQRRLYDFAFKAKLAAIKAGPPWDKLASAVFDPLVFKEISRGMLGDRIRVVSSGGAPIATHVEEFMRVCGCAQFVQGYGLTETCAATFVTYGKEPSHMYTVGPPQPTFQVRLEAVPDMDYDPLGEPPRGEVLVRGGGLFSGYYKDEDETRKALDAEGFFHTGDVGELTPCGALRIIDRRKNIFKLSQGEYIAVEKIEGVLSESPLIDQVWVHGSRYESCLVAVVVPAKGKLQAWANEQGIQTAGWGELCGDSEVRRLLQKEIDTVGKQGGLKSFELPKAIVVACEPFAVANNLLTPTLELRRTALLQHFTPAIDALYAGMQKQEKREEKKAHGKHHSKAHALKTQAKYALKRLGRSLK